MEIITYVLRLYTKTGRKKRKKGRKRVKAAEVPCRDQE